ncbi:hypothetical protein GWN63_00410, partial [Candidatus Bathyarchaeota archaeon]|nr:hypothetical protein [Candidatus Bathyarchaeota archaeon]
SIIAITSADSSVDVSPLKEQLSSVSKALKGLKSTSAKLAAEVEKAHKKEDVFEAAKAFKFDVFPVMDELRGYGD